MKRSTVPQRKKTKLRTEICDYYANVEAARKKEREERTEYEALESTQIFNKATNLVQKATQREKTLNLQYEELVNAVAQETFETIKQLYEEKDDVSDEYFENIVHSTRFLFLKIKGMAEDPHVSNVQQHNQLSVYESLFVRLIDEVDSRFVIYAPERILSRKTRVVNFKPISKPLAKKLFIRVKDMGLLKDEELNEAYFGYIKKCVEQTQQSTVDSDN